MKRNIFDGVAGNSPALNRFDLSYTNTFTAKIGLLYPVQVDEVYPGDVFKMSSFCHCEVQPMVAPLMSDLTIFAHTFFVPYRIIYGVDTEDGQSIWEKFITGGKSGDYDTPLPAWNPSGYSTTGFSSGLIWDYIGNPMNMTIVDGVTTWTPLCPSELNVSIAPKYAYNRIFNDFYRDENLVEEVSLDNEGLLNRAFKKDYFTSALESQQRGETPALPVDITGTLNLPLVAEAVSAATGGAISGEVSISSISPTVLGTSVNTAANLSGYSGIYGSYYSTHPQSSFDYANADSLLELGVKQDPSKIASSGNYSNISALGVNGSSFSQTPIDVQTKVSGYAEGDVTGLTASTFDIADLRLAFAIQRLQELSMRAGYRYTEFLSSHYGCNPTDARLDRPEYVGGCMIPVNVSPSVQTSSTDNTTAQGNKVGIANANSIEKIGNYRVLEHGLIMTIVSIVPKPIYQQGINRQWLRQTRFDYYFPEFANLSEQGVYNAELYVDSTDGEDSNIFGYQAHWNEMRCKNNMISGSVREQYDYWSLARKFGSRPHLNEDFIKVQDSEFNRVFAVQDEDEFIISWSNIIDAYRPIPASGIPGRVDHVYGGI